MVVGEVSEEKGHWGKVHYASSFLAKLATYLLDDIVEVAAGVLALDLLLDPPVGGKVCDIHIISRASTTGEDSKVPMGYSYRWILIGTYRYTYGYLCRGYIIDVHLLII